MLVEKLIKTATGKPRGGSRRERRRHAGINVWSQDADLGGGTARLLAKVVILIREIGKQPQPRDFSACINRINSSRSRAAPARQSTAADQAGWWCNCRASIPVASGR